MNSSRVVSALVAGILAVLSNAKWIEAHKTMKNSEIFLQQNITSTRRSNPQCMKEQFPIGEWSLNREQGVSVSAMNYQQLQKVSVCLPGGDQEINYLTDVRVYIDAKNTKRFWLLISLFFDLILLITVGSVLLSSK